VSAHTYAVTLKDQIVKVTSDELTVFKTMMFLGPPDLGSRISELLWLDLYVLDAAFGVSPHDILRAIQEVENGDGASSGVKPATQFKNLSLKGLWHKHYFSAHFLVNNIVLALGEHGLENLVKEVMDPAKSPVITREMVNELAHRVANEPIEGRSAAKKLTGEWIIYIENAGKKYYLCCNTHNAGDQLIYDRIIQNCVRDFPELPEWLKAARA
jgi:hypothetical protein